MKLVVPYIGELCDVDTRMVRLAEFLGIPCETLALADVSDRASFLEKTVSDQCSCFVVNAQVMKEWVGLDGVPSDLVVFLLSRFPHLLVYGLRANIFDSQMVAALSRGRLKSVDTIAGNHLVFEIAKDSQEVCEAFAGLSLGPASSVNDHVFDTNGSDPVLQQLISIGGRPFMAAVKVEGAEIIFVGSEEVADMNAEVGDAPLAEYFSRFLPYAMALRYVAGDECWRPNSAHASITIDDPLLRKSYGFLNFESLLRLADQHNFHAAIAFIPHNFRRNSSQTTRLIRENAARLSICFHGNDHLEGEFKSTDLALLDTLVRIAEDRMSLHQQMSGLTCDRVMVFPQGYFSMEAMKVLKSHNFLAAVNTVPYPAEQPVRLTIAELAQPAVLRYGGFPLFLRKTIRQTQSHDIAFNLFFGRPVLIVEHHEIFRNPELLAEIAERINSVASEVHWSNLATGVSNSFLKRRTPDGVHHVRAYAGAIRLSNDSDSAARYLIEWGDSSVRTSIEQVLLDGLPDVALQIDDDRLSMELAPNSSKTLSLVNRNVPCAVRKLGMRWNTQAYLRRRLSEVRDNYLSKNRHLLGVAREFQRRFIKV